MHLKKENRATLPIWFAECGHNTDDIQVNTVEQISVWKTQTMWSVSVVNTSDLCYSVIQY